MKASFLACLVAFAALSPALAADVDWRRPAGRSYRIAPLPIAPDSLSATVLASDGCWRACEAHCGWHVRKCVKFNGLTTGLTDCLPANDACDRFCVRRCRAYGGPLLNWTD
jgi:hypothetical protein